MLCTHLFYIFSAFSSAMVFIASAMNQFCFVEELLSKSAAIRSGAEDLVGMSRQEYINRLTWVKELMRYNFSNWANRKTFERVSQTLEMLKLDNSNGSLRKQPYCILLTGNPGCGKSSYALQIAAACVRARYGRAHPNDIVILNETDEFQSEFRSSHKVVIFDDVGAEKPSSRTPNPWRKVLDFVNNIRKTSLNPNVEMKGNVYIEPELVIVTTNLREPFNVPFYMSAPSAIYRRVSKMIELNSGFKMATVLPTENKFSDPHCVYDGGPVPVRCGTGKPIHRDSLLKSIVEEFEQHAHEQEIFISLANSILDTAEDTSESSLICFYRDMIYPYLPRCIPLEPRLEALLPFYHRWWRKLCVPHENMAVCMSCDKIQPQAHVKNELSEKLEGLNDIDDFLALPLEAKKELIELITLRGVNWEYYGRLRSFILRDSVIAIHPGAFANRYGIFSTGEPIYDYEQINLDLGPRTVLSVTKTEKYYRKYLQEIAEPSSSAGSESDVNMIWHFTFRTSKEVLEVSDLATRREWMNRDLGDRVLGTLRANDPMIIVQYLLAIRASDRKFKCLGVEFPLSETRPDVVLRSGKTYVIIECKNSKKNIGRKQVVKYLRVCEESGDDALGVLLTQREVKFYSLTTINGSTLRNTRLLIKDVLCELSRKHKAFGTNHFRTKEDRCGAVEDLSDL